MAKSGLIPPDPPGIVHLESAVALDHRHDVVGDRRTAR